MNKPTGLFYLFTYANAELSHLYFLGKCLARIAIVGWLMACSNANIHHFEIKETGGKFMADSIAEFTFFVEDTSKVYSIKSVLFYTNEYPFSNLYLTREIYFEGQQEYADTANYILFDETGKMTGKGFSGVKKLENTIGRGPLRFVNIGYYTVELRNVMRMDTLPGIEKIGIIITEEKQ